MSPLSLLTLNVFHLFLSPALAEPPPTNAPTRDSAIQARINQVNALNKRIIETQDIPPDVRAAAALIKPKPRLKVDSQIEDSGDLDEKKDPNKVRIAPAATPQKSSPKLTSTPAASSTPDPSSSEDKKEIASPGYAEPAIIFKSSN